MALPANYYSADIKNVIFGGDALRNLRSLASESVDCIVTSPPYYGLRDYGQSGQIGLEDTPEAYIDKLVTVFREARRVLKNEGTLWLNLGDSYWANRSQNGDIGRPGNLSKIHQGRAGGKSHSIYKPKDLMMIPARVALALQADGWFLRSDIIWHKPNCMPESVKDRPTNDYEHVFLLSKSRQYFYNADAIREFAPNDTRVRPFRDGDESTLRKDNGRIYEPSGYRNKRAVWSISTKAYSKAHFAVMPLELADTCIKAGCPKGGIVLDPFGGAGTTAIAALQNLSHYLLIELNISYIELAQKRIKQQLLEGVQLSLFKDSA